MKFPEDFTEQKHSGIANATQWTIKNKDEQTIISIVGRGRGVLGDGINTFEMWDFREDKPQSYLTKEQINNHLINNPW